MNASLGPQRLLAVAAVALAAAVPAGAGIAGSSRVSAAPTTYSDPAGDANGAPDITGVDVSNDNAGTITMRISVPDRPQLGVEDALLLWIDADRNDLTGRFGDEYRLLRFAFGAVLERWNGSAWESYAPPSVVLRWETGQLVFAVKGSDLGIAEAFDFDLGSVTFAGDDPDAWPFDNAPDFGSWTYTILVAPTAGPSVLRPANPKAGGLLSVAVRVTANGKPVDAGTVKCGATLGGKRLAASGSGLSGGVAGCTWRLPRTAAGKTLRGSVTVTTAGGTASRTFSAKVR